MDHARTKNDMVQDVAGEESTRECMRSYIFVCLCAWVVSVCLSSSSKSRIRSDLFWLIPCRAYLFLTLIVPSPLPRTLQSFTWIFFLSFIFLLSPSTCSVNFRWINFPFCVILSRAHSLLFSFFSSIALLTPNTSTICKLKETKRKWNRTNTRQVRNHENIFYAILTL